MFNVSEIKKDLSNGPYHRLGQHVNCNKYFCIGPTANGLDLVPEAEKSGMMQEIKNYTLRLENNAESLLENKNNNICEQFNAIINKHIAGKRINFSQRGNYNIRVYAAVISFNSKEYLRCIHKKYQPSVQVK